MGFLDRLFRGKKSIASVIIETQNSIFTIYGIKNPTDAQKLKASVYICITAIATINHFGDGRLRHVIDNISKEARELTKLLQLRVGDLANDKDNLRDIIDDFPDSLQITESTNVNGLAAFEAIFLIKGEKLTNDILSHTGGPFGIHGYAAIVVGDGIFGIGKSREHFMELSMLLLKFTKELSEVI